ncbi:MAG: hypothetical protein L0Y71_03020 [Gemmataceae bacterium]|nr:hypothetical protein [Gemmataceae bacterium]
MQGSSWIEMLRRVPSELYDSLALGLVTGAEVVVQQLIRLEHDFVVVRGRMAGSTAEGRVMIVPYSHMATMAFNKRMAETEVQQIFGAPLSTGSSAPAAWAEPSVAEAAAQPAPAEAPPANGQSASIPPAPPAKSTRPDAPKPPQSKSILLARLRERLAEKAK